MGSHAGSLLVIQHLYVKRCPSCSSPMRYVVRVAAVSDQPTPKPLAP